MSSGETTINLTKHFLPFYLDDKTIEVFILQTFPRAIQYKSSPKFLRRNSILGPNIEHLSNHPDIIPL